MLNIKHRLVKCSFTKKINFLGLIDDKIVLATIQYLKKIGWNVQEILVHDYPRDLDLKYTKK